MANHLVRSGDNIDLTKERNSGTFSTEEMAIFLNDSKEKLDRSREINRLVEADPELVGAGRPEFLSREKRIDAQVRKVRRMMSRIHELADITNQEEMGKVVSAVFGSDGFPLLLHFGMFIPVLGRQADDELCDEFLPRAMNLEIIGTYAQTEMGHGTNLRELETTATYDKRTQEFVLNTPTRSAMKWWPGNLGKMSNYAIVTAILHIDDKSYGPHQFFVQLRSEKDHKPLAGITIGDIGPKMGFNVTDNGFLGFDHVRIPRKQMLMKHAQVSVDGIYTPPMHAKLGYGGMVQVRAHMIHMHAVGLATAATIATRYSAIRRQGRIEKDRPEVQVLDYQTQQYRIFPQIAKAYAYCFAGMEVEEIYERTMEGLEKGDAELLPDLHAVTSCIKPVVTFSIGQATEQCRMACGGHGYSMASGLPQLYALLVAGCTYEGENLVLLQQAAKYLMKSVEKAARGEPLANSVQFLGKKGEGKSQVGKTEGNLEKEIEALLHSLEHVARRLAIEASEEWEKRVMSGENREKARNGVTVEMNRAARVYARLFIANAFHRRVLAAPASLRSVLFDLFSLYLNYECVDMASHLLQDGHCTGKQIDYMKRRLYEDLAKIRPNAVSLVDSFDISDRFLNSMLGNRDGNVYEALFQWAKASELNYTDVMPAFDHLKAMMG